MISVHSSLFFDEHKDRNGVERNRLFISFNYQLTLMEMKAEIRDRIMSHEKPVVAALYNTVYNQVCNCLYSKTVLSCHSKRGPKNVFQDRLSLKCRSKVLQNALWSILQYFRPSLSYHLSYGPLFCLFLSCRLRKVLL